MVSAMTLSNGVKWDKLSFASTLYLYPVIDTLLEHAPSQMRDELRLGLQEALVNAAKHGNSLDPSKHVSVQYAEVQGCYWWIITDQGNGFEIPHGCRICPDDGSDGESLGDCGRGLFILHQIFDQVHWSPKGNEVHLCKRLRRRPNWLLWWQDLWGAKGTVAMG
ncbi:anti-sigma regulatory factor [Leptolyngbyaceae cyanobacterium CCMR0082]|uniref:Anti-sigma regulatory factor n=3 Tax=Adonisia TaxID=2950183 RepID=A0A6M0S5V2_9CYAN|nr:anti-sigma regulatory factor [Adonisia turfae CCMR0081]NEZ63453.1 anti-sigma regulatory factor [Adonisia turfae CCMR0082]